ncbi:MAG: hypothetical protein JWL97_1795 [Gemmatimonadales bacterium]|nr:hypothetical protein [Gemmatimonadales bacterium]
MLRKTHLTCSAALLLAVAACSSSTDLSTTLSASAAAKLAADMDAVSSLGAADFGLGATVAIRAAGSGASVSATAPVAINNTFSVTKQCPQGGNVVLAGTIVGTGDQSTRSLAVDANATRTDTGCAFTTDDGVLTLNGNPNIAYTGHLNVVSGVLSGLQTQTHKGSFKWARTGGSGTCDVDLSSSYDPATHTATVTGTFCGKTINVTRTR